MPRLSRETTAYERHLQSWSGELAAGGVAALLTSLAPGSHRADVERYVDNAMGERMRLLTEETRMLALAFDNLAVLIERYARDVPRITFSLETRELPRFLDWLRRTQRLNLQQADFIAYQHAECDCLALAGTERTAYIEFQRRLRAQSEQAMQGEIDPMRRIYVNPIQVWAQLSGIAVGADAEERQDVVFFAHQGEVRMFWRSGLAMRLVSQLRALAPCTLDAWCRAAAVELTEAVSLTHALCDAGLAIFM